MERSIRKPETHVIDTEQDIELITDQLLLEITKGNESKEDIFLRDLVVKIAELIERLKQADINYEKLREDKTILLDHILDTFGESTIAAKLISVADTYIRCS